MILQPRKLTPERHDAIVAAIERGLSYRDSALCAGISERTLRNWRALGEQAKSGKAWELVAAIAEAEARARQKVADSLYSGVTEVRLVKKRHVRRVVDAKGQPTGDTVIEEWTEEHLPDPRIQLEWLTRRDPEHWAKRDPEIRAGDQAHADARKILGL